MHRRTTAWPNMMMTISPAPIKGFVFSNVGHFEGFFKVFSSLTAKIFTSFFHRLQTFLQLFFPPTDTTKWHRLKSVKIRFNQQWPNTVVVYHFHFSLPS